MGEYYEEFPPPFFLSSEAAHRPLRVNDKAYHRPDRDVLADVQDHVATLQGIDTSKVKITVAANVVTLRGEVENAAISRYLSHIADNTLGVRDVINELELRRAGGGSTSPDSAL